MKLLAADGHAVHLIGSGGMGLSHPTDAHIYAITSGDEVALIDAGSGICPELLQENLQADGISVARIRQVILTHAHWDHARGSAWWHQRCGADILVHRHGQATVEQAAWQSGHLARHGIASSPAPVARTLQDGDEIAVGALRLQVLHTPGHSSDSICLAMPLGGLRVLFSGDSAFAEGQHGTLTAESDLRAYRDAVHRLASLSIDALLPSHKHFVLSRAHAHLALLAQRLAGGWTALETRRVPFFPSWWLEHDARLYDDAR